MAFGVLEDTNCSQPTGTTLIEALSCVDGTSKPHVVLKPVPSDDLSDPLRLSRVRKELLFLTIVFGACLTGVIGPVLVPGFGIIAVFFDITLTQVTLLNGSLVMALGVSAYFCGCLAVLWGKRLIFMGTTLILIVACIWGAAAQSYGSLLGSRVLQGCGMGGFFGLAGTASINDVFFVHERGTRVGLWNLAVISSVNVAPIISGYVIVELGWRWSFWLLAVSFGVLLVLIVFCFPETTFDRNTSEAVLQPISASSSAGTLKDYSSEKKDSKTLDPEPAVERPQDGLFHIQASKWKKLLRVQSVNFGRPSQIITTCVRPLGLMRHPVVVWGCVMWSVTFTWAIIIGSIASQIFAAPPYNLSPTQVGNLVGIAPLIGSTLGTVFGGWFCDFTSKQLAIRNNGIYEPEFRLWIMVPFLLTFVAGSFGLGFAISAKLSAITAGVFLAILNFAIGMGCTGIVVYQNDACQQRAGEAFGLGMLMKSAFAFGLTFVFNNYYASIGPKVFFSTWGGLTVGVTLFTLPLYVYGKKIRSWAQIKDIL